jgi:hypothetical protein
MRQHLYTAAPRSLHTVHVFEPRRLGSIDMVQAFGHLIFNLGGRVMNVRLCFDIWHVAPYFVRGSSLPPGGPPRKTEEPRTK